MIATTGAAPEGFEPWLQSLFYLVGLATAAIVLWKQFFPGTSTTSIQQPLRVRAEMRMATHEELLQLRREFESFKIEQRLSNDKMLAAGEARALAIHDRINAVLEAVSEIRGELKHR